MCTHRILVVEDNPITRKLLDLTLRTEGYDVALAIDGASALRALDEALPDLIVQDVKLPDVDGHELLARFRSRADAATVPVLAVSGVVDESDAIGFDGFLTKPVTPSRLLQVVQGFLQSRGASTDRPGEGKCVLVVDDDPLQRRLLAKLLQEQGFTVDTAQDGREALDAARRHEYYAVISDILMPRLDGFNLCLALRQHSKLVRVPVLLVSSHFTKEEDQRIAEAVGATALIARGASGRSLAEELRRVLGAPRSEVASGALGVSADVIADRIATRASEQMVWDRRLETLEAIFELLTVLPASVGNGSSLPDILARCLDAAGLDRGALILAVAGGLRVESVAGWTKLEGERLLAGLSARGLLGDTGGPSRGACQVDLTHLLGIGAGAVHGVLARVQSGHEDLGFLVLACENREVGKECLHFASALAGQMGHVVLLARAIERANASERERAKTDEQLRLILDSSPAAIYVFHLDTLVVDFVSENVRGQVGYEAREFLADPTLWTRSVHPDDRPGIDKGLDRLRKTGTAAYEYRFRCKDGTWRWMHSDVRLVNGVSGLGDDVVGCWTDVTDHRHLEAQFRQAQKMEIVGRLAGGVAHDFNNMLTPILGYAQILRTKLGAGAVGGKELEEIRKAAERAAGLTRQLLAFSRKQVLQPRLVDVNAIVSGVLRMLSRLVGEDIDLSADLTAISDRILADPGQLEQVLMNLVVNARDAMGPGGRIVIRTKCVVSGGFASSCGEPVPAGRYVLLSVEDTGTGMSPEVMSHLFEPFFTTKELGKGTGLGLSTVYGIVKQSGGYVKVSSEPGVGSRFDVYLFVAQPSTVDEVTKPVPPAPKACDGEVVLLVEDDLAVREVSRALLQASGWRVMEAHDGEQAFAIASQGGVRIDAVVTDTVMPRLGGFELADRLKEQGRGIPMVFATGYTDRKGDMEAQRRSGAPYLQKPYTADDLARAVRQAIDGASKETRP